MAELSFKQWQTESVRLTTFHQPGLNLGVPNWWTELVGVQPEKTTFLRRTRTIAEEGPLAGAKLALIIQPGRVDWNLTFLQSSAEEAETDEATSEDSFCVPPESLNKSYDLMLKWLSSEACPAFERVAFGAILREPVQDRVAGYRRLDTYLHDVNLSPNARDFNYRINRRRASRLGIPDMEINRLSTWSVANRRRIGAHWSVPADAEPKASVYAEEGQYFCRLELDINTIHEFRGEIPQEKYAPLFEELVSFGREIAGRGDIE